MSKILKSLQITTQSASPSTPSTGTGALFASGSSIYFENSSGTVYDIAATNGYINVLSYTGSTDGTTAIYSWSKPPSLKYLDICCVGAGGGGASGRITNSNNQVGSSGGGGGAIVWQSIEAARLTASPYTITVGAGGTPGAARITNGSAQAGAVGTTGGNTSFGTLVVATGGQGGQIAANGGTGQVVAFGGRLEECTPRLGPWGLHGNASGWNNGNGLTGPVAPRAVFNRQTNPPVASSIVFNVSMSWGNGAAGGGSGASRSSVITAGTSGSTITGFTNGGAPGVSNAAGPGTAGSNGINNQISNLLLRYSDSTTLTSYGLGTGGGGGGGGTTAGAAGGNGGYYGAGGGGGGVLFGLGSVLVPSSSGAGGSGSSGLCVLIEYY
jgi:hypothetical protein